MSKEGTESSKSSGGPGDGSPSKKVVPTVDGVAAGGAEAGAGQAGEAPATRTDGPSDEALLAAHIAGDKTALRGLISRYERELLHFLYRFMGDRAAAEDVFQEAFLQVHQSAAQFDTERRFKPWLFTIAANKARDQLRSAARRPASSLQSTMDGDDSGTTEFLSLMASDEETPETHLEREELRAMVQSVVMSMPANLREILLLSYFNQFPYKQISEILDIPVGTVKSRLHSAVAYFAQRWRSSNPSSSAS